MKKIILIFLSTLLFSNILYANEKLYSFIGVQTAISQFDSHTVPSIGLKYGKQSKDIRTAITYNYGSKSDNTFQSLIMQIDTGILIKKFKDKPFKPYIGTSFGVIQQKNSKILKYEDKGFVYGINTGLSYILNNNLDLDLGYRFLKTSKMKSLETINDINFAFHYFY